MNNIKLCLTRLHGFHKLLAVLLAVVIAVSVPIAVSLQVSAVDNAAEVTPVKQDFEGNFNITATKSGEYSINTDPTKAHTGNKSIKAFREGTYHNLLRITDNDGNNIVVNQGDTVVIRYYVMIENSTEEGVGVVNWFQVVPFLTASGIGSRTVQGGVTQYDGNTAKNVWHEKTVSFTATGNNTLLALSLNRGNNAAKVGNIYLDDISVTVIPADNNYVWLDLDDTGSKYQIIQGKAGDAVTLPVLEKENYTFKGWADKATNEAFTGTTIPSTSVHLIPQWTRSGYTQDFEGNFNITATKSGEYSINTDPTKAHTGNKSIKAFREGTYHNLLRITDNDGNNIVVNQGDTVVIRYYVMIENSTEEGVGAVNWFQVVPFLTASGIGSRTAQGGVTQYDGNTAKNVWHEKTVSFTATGTNTLLALSLNRGNNAAKVGNIYLDDISVTVIPADNNYVWLDLDDTGSKYQIIQGKAGDAITLPVLEKENYTFKGWVDKTTGEAFTGTTIPSTSVHLTAKWFKAEYTQDFENGFNITAINAGEYSVNTDPENARSGNNSLKAVRTTGRNLIRITDNDGENVKLSAGDTCIIRFYVMIEDTADDGVSKMNWVQFSPFLTANSLYTRTQQSGSVIYSGGTARNEWQEVTFSFKATGNNTLLALDLYRGSNTAKVGNIYVDDINITVVPAENSYVWLDYDLNGSKYEIIQGKAGDAITLPQLESENGTFIGWADKTTDAIFTGTTIPAEPVHLYAKFDRSDYTVDFEDGKIKSWGGFAINSDTANVKGGSYSLKAEKSTTGSTFALLKHENEDIKLENGETYVVNMNYKLVDPDNNASFLQLSLTRVGAGITGTRVPLGGGTLVINGTTPEEEWLKYSYTFTADTTENAASNYLALQYYVGTTSADNTAQVYVDDITIHKLDDDESLATFTYKDGKGQRSTLYGTKGTVLTAPEVTRKDYVIRNWCTDSDLTKVYEAWLFGEENITLYANWMLDNTSRSWIFDFENNHFINGWGGFSLNTNSKNSLSKSNSVKFSNYKPTQTAFAYLAKDGQKVLLEEGCTYVVTVKYKVVDVDGGDKMQFGQFGIYTSNASLQNRKNQSGVKVITGSTERDKWLEHTFVFTVDTDVVDSTNLILCFYNGKNGGYSDVYFDDITVKEYGYDTKAVVLNYNDNTGRKQIITEKSGSKFTLPAIKRDGYKLLGWFTDSALTQKYETTVFPDKVVNLYAAWTVEQTGNTWHLDFEDTDEFLNSNYAEAGYSADNEIYHDGKQSLKCDYPGISNYRATLSLDGKPFIVEPGAQYVISYWSYVPSSRQFYTLAEINFWTSNINNKTSNSVRQTKSGGSQDGAIQVLRWNSPVDTWVKHTTVFTVSEDIGYNNALNICVKGNPGTTVVYFDDMTITKIEDGNSYILYHSNDDEQTDYLIQGKPGKKVNVYEAKLKTDCAFFGWYKDTAYTEQATDKELSVIPKDSFSVFGQQIKVRYIQDFEDYVANLGVMERDYELYTPDTLGYTAKNVHGGKNSVHRIGDMNQSKIFLPFIKQTDGLSFEKEYVLIFWMKVEEFDENNTYLEIARENSWCYTRSVDSSSSYQKILNLSDCEMGEWRQYTFTFTNINSFIGFKTPANSEIYFDDVAIYLKGYEEMDNLIEHDDVVELETIKDTVISISPDSIDPDNNTDTQADETVGMIWVVCAIVAGVILVAGTATTIIIIRRKKSKREDKKV